MQYDQLSDSEDSSDIGSGTDSSDSSSGSESESSSEGENVPMTRMNSRKIKLRKEMADSKASEVFTKMLEKNDLEKLAWKISNTDLLPMSEET